MARSEAQFLQEMLSLPPSGAALPREPTSNFGIFLSPLAGALSDVQSYAESMLAQLDPRVATQFLGDFARVLGPDPYGRDTPAQGLSAAQLAALLWQRWTGIEGCAIADWMALATAAGQQITIEEFSASLSGAAITGESVATTAAAQFYWQVNLAVADVEHAVSGVAVAGNLIGTYAPNLIGPMFQALAPAHTELVLNYIPNYTPLNLVTDWETPSATTGSSWSIAPSSGVPPLLSGVTVFEATQIAAIGDSNAATVPFEAAAGQQVALSIWVYFPPGFTPSQCEFRGDYLTDVVRGSLDLSLTGQWQLVTATATVGPNAGSPAPMVLAVEAAVGQSFYLTCFNAQLGSVASNYANLEA